VDASKTLIWRGPGEDRRLEIARVTIAGTELLAIGTQIGASYVLTYQLAPGLLSLEIAGERLKLELGDADFFDLGLSPLFNSLLVRRDDLLHALGPRDYTMLWVSVPELAVERSKQRYEPLGDNRIRFSAGSFVVDLAFDEDGFILDYPGLAIRIS
jgi:uncharacterized protein